MTVLVVTIALILLAFYGDKALERFETRKRNDQGIQAWGTKWH